MGGFSAMAPGSNSTWHDQERETRIEEMKLVSKPSGFGAANDAHTMSLLFSREGSLRAKRVLAARSRTEPAASEAGLPPVMSDNVPIRFVLHHEYSVLFGQPQFDTRT